MRWTTSGVHVAHSVAVVVAFEDVERDLLVPVRPGHIRGRGRDRLGGGGQAPYQIAMRRLPERVKRC